jgi:putative glutamine amidotransferase
MQPSNLSGTCETRRPAPRVKRVVTMKDSGDVSPYLEALRTVGIEAAFGSLEDGDGLMLTGGPDVNPARYGEAKRTETEPPDNERDDREIALIARALELDLPILAICRGMQILNVQHGGTLVQHLETVQRHRQRPKDKSLNAHEIEIAPGTRLAGIAGDPLRRGVNSRHHQAVGRLGNGLVISAIDIEDGIIEAIERADRRFVIGVEWHPENQIASQTGIARRLFEAFAAAL